MRKVLHMYTILTFSSNFKVSKIQVNSNKIWFCRNHGDTKPLENILTKEQLKIMMLTWFFLLNIFAFMKHFHQVSRYMYYYMSSHEIPKTSLSLICPGIGTPKIREVRWFVNQWPLSFFHFRPQSWFSLCHKKGCACTLSKKRKQNSKKI